MAVAAKVEDVAKRSEKALVKRFCEKNFTEFLARVEKMVTSRKTGTNSGGFSVSRNGDSGNRLAAGEILPPFLFLLIVFLLCRIIL